MVLSIGGVVSTLEELVSSVSNRFKYSSEKLTSFSFHPVFVTAALASLLLSKFSKSTIMEINSLCWVEKSWMFECFHSNFSKEVFSMLFFWSSCIFSSISASSYIYTYIYIYIYMYTDPNYANPIQNQLIKDDQH